MSWPDIDPATVTIPNNTTNTDVRTESLRACFAGTTAPASPVEGQLWLDTNYTPPILKQYQSAAWVPIASFQWEANKECNLKQALNFVVENQGALDAAATLGRLQYLTTDGKLYLDDGAENQVLHSGEVTVRRFLALTDGGKDVTNPPTVAAKGTTPTGRGLLFDAVNELYSFGFVVPANWDGASDMSLKLLCALDGAETANDDIDWSADLVAVTPGADAASKTSTALVASLTDIASKNAEGDVTLCSLTLDHDDATNPIAAGDLVVVEIHRTDLAEVGGVILLAAYLEYTALNAG